MTDWLAAIVAAVVAVPLTALVYAWRDRRPRRQDGPECRCASPDRCPVHDAAWP